MIFRFFLVDLFNPVFKEIIPNKIFVYHGLNNDVRHERYDTTVLNLGDLLDSELLQAKVNWKKMTLSGIHLDKKDFFKLTPEAAKSAKKLQRFINNPYTHIYRNQYGIAVCITKDILYNKLYDIISVRNDRQMSEVKTIDLRLKLKSIINH